MTHASRRALAALMAVATLGALTVNSGMRAPVAGAAPVAQQARMADEFVDSIGVGAHLTYGDTSYGNYPMIKQRLLESGIRHIRDGWGTGSQYAIDFLRELNVAGGVKVSFVTDARSNATPVEIRDMVRDRMGGLISTIEGPNEWDAQSYLTYKGMSFPDGVRAWQTELAAAFRGDPATAGIPLAGPSFACQNCSDSFRQLGDISSLVDYGNAHDYPGGRMLDDGTMDMILANNSISTGNRRLISSETDYSTKVSATDAGHPPVAEPQAAVLGLRVYLEHFRRGWLRSFKYEFVDDNPDNAWESGFGMLHSDYSPKPMFTATKNLITLLSDRGPAFAPGQLAYSLTGADANTRTLLLQKRDGTFWLAVWQQTEVWDGSTLTPLAPANVPVALALSQAAAQIQAYMPIRGTGAVASAANATSLPFASSAEVTLLKISAPPTTPPPAPIVITRTYHFAEGSTRAGIQTYLTLANFSSTLAATVKITYLVTPRAGAGPAPVTRTLAPGSRTTVDVNADVGPERDVSSVVEVLDGPGIGAERVVFVKRRVGNAGEIDDGTVGLPSPEPVRRAVFSEGSTRQGIQTYLTLLNPDPLESSVVRVTYNFNDSPSPLRVDKTVPARGRLTIDVNADVGPERDVASFVEVVSGPGVVAERPVYVQRRVGHGELLAGATDSGGATAGPSDLWNFAEGSTQAGFHTYMSLYNPGPSDAMAEVTYRFTDGTELRASHSVRSQQRETVDVNNDVRAERDVALSVRVISGPPIYAERPQYFSRHIGAAGKVAGAHDTLGMREPVVRWLFAEGSSRPGFQTYYTLMNPGAVALEVKMTLFLGEGGAPLARKLNLLPHSRATVDLNAELSAAGHGGADASGMVEVTTPGSPGVFAERSVYFSALVAGLSVDGGTNAQGMAG